ncbi:arylesterase [Paracoccus sp. PAR01]|uniref:arylesterase n=1 Tax=Paracoccus sp. PAR01 TaxID=2769282 RepID=UPI00177E381B|nr:arylesterase [Paracoccus sp. PAR01]
MTIRSIALVIGLCLPLAAWADPVRLLAFGDSLTAGYGLPAEDGLVPQLQGWLRGRGHDVEVLNAGVSGETTADGVSRIKQDLEKHAPDAVIVELGGNDLLRGTAPGKAARNLDFIMKQAGDGDRPLLLVGIALPDSDNPQGRTWAAIWPRLARVHDALLLENLYAPFFALPKPEMLTMLQPDKLHPSSAGVKAIVVELGPKVEELIDRVEAQNAVQVPQSASLN